MYTYILLHISYTSLCIHVFIIRIAYVCIDGMYVNAINVSGLHPEASGFEYKKFQIHSFIHSFKSNV